MEILLRPEDVTPVTECGACRVVQRYENGVAVGPEVRNGGEVRRVPGAVIVRGADLSDVEVTLRTSTPLDEVPAGVIYRAEGEVSLRVRAEGRPSFGDGGPRGALIGVLYVERLVAVGNLVDLLAKGGQPQHQHRKPDAP